MDGFHTGKELGDKKADKAGREEGKEKVQLKDDDVLDSACKIGEYFKGDPP